MAETVIYPLSEETGLRILAALLRIATALEGEEPTYTASVSGDKLSITGSTVNVDGDKLVISVPSVSVEDDKLAL